jgi:hypothetical protein
MLSAEVGKVIHVPGPPSHVYSCLWPPLWASGMWAMPHATVLLGTPQPLHLPQSVLYKSVWSQVRAVKSTQSCKPDKIRCPRSVAQEPLSSPTACVCWVCLLWCSILVLCFLSFPLIMGHWAWEHFFMDGSLYRNNNLNKNTWCLAHHLESIQNSNCYGFND